MSKPLTISKRDQVRGLYTFCNKCKTLTKSGQCKSTGKSLKTCPNPESHVFKAIFSIPGSDGRKRKTRVFDTKDVKEAIKLTLDFEKELMNQDYQKVPEPETPVKPTKLIECMALYIGYLNNENVQEHQIKKRSSAHIKEVERFLKYFCLAIKKNRLDHSTLLISRVDDSIVGMFHSYLLEDLGYSNKSYNKAMAQLRQFMNWLIDKHGYTLSNPFAEVARKREVTDKSVITKSEMEALLASLSPENGCQELSTGEKKYHYFPWLKHAFRLALETGLRREEFMTLKFSQIQLDEQGNPSYITQENFKVNRIKGLDESSGKEVKVIPITAGLLDLLYELGYVDYADSDLFLIDPFSKVTRRTMINQVSKSFSHYWKKLGSEKNLQLKHLRKTYISQLAKVYGNKASIITSHSTLDVMKKHYINQGVVSEMVKGFRVFG